MGEEAWYQASLHQKKTRSPARWQAGRAHRELLGQELGWLQAELGRGALDTQGSPAHVGFSWCHWADPQKLRLQREEWLQMDEVLAGVWCSVPVGLSVLRTSSSKAWGHGALLAAGCLPSGVKVEGKAQRSRATACFQVASSQGLLPARRRIQGGECGPFLSPSLLFFFFHCGIQGHCQKHIQHNQTSDGDSFPTACVSENSEIIPMF